jgi:hypothetical protein
MVKHDGRHRRGHQCSSRNVDESIDLFQLVLKALDGLEWVQVKQGAAIGAPVAAIKQEDGSCPSGTGQFRAVSMATVRRRKIDRQAHESPQLARVSIGGEKRLILKFAVLPSVSASLAGSRRQFEEIHLQPLSTKVESLPEPARNGSPIGTVASTATP